MHNAIINYNKVNLFTDHADGNQLNNQRYNLRPSTKAQNCSNRKIRKNNNSSKYVGVCWKKENNKWCAVISHQNKSLWLGYFKNEEEAAKEYDNAALKLKGNFSVLNFPIEGPKSEAK